MHSFRTKDFNKMLDNLPEEIGRVASEVYAKWSKDPNSVNYKALQQFNNKVISVELKGFYRAMAYRGKSPSGDPCYLWYFIGTHEDYNKMLNGKDNTKKVEQVHVKLNDILDYRCKQDPNSSLCKRTSPNSS